jgi:hypothetical protein
MNQASFVRFERLFAAGYAEVATEFTIASEAQVASAEDLARLGHCQMKVGLTEQAEHALAYALNAGIADAQSRLHAIEDLSSVKQSLGKFEEAVPLDRLLQGKEWHELRAQTGLRNHDPLAEALRSGHDRLLLDQSMEQKSITVLPWGGAGDLMEQIRYVEDLKAEGAAEIHIYPSPAILELLVNSRLPIDWGVFSMERFHACHYWARTVDLALRYRRTPEETFARRGYLKQIGPDAQRLALPQPRIGGASARKVGVVWRSDNEISAFEPYRSMRLEQLTQVLSSPGIQFYGLQYGRLSRQESSILEVHAALSLSPAIQNFADTAAFLEQLDLLITIDSSPAHLAGALDIPVWTMLTAAPDWRWGARTATTTPLYPSMYLFRQSKLGDWTPVIEQVATALRNLT